MGYLIFTALVICMAAALASAMGKRLERWYTRLKQKPVIHINTEIFSNGYLDVKAFYLQEFGETPCANYISNIDPDKAIEYIAGGAVGNILATYQQHYYDWKNQKQQLTATIFKLENKVLIEVYNHGIAIMHLHNPAYANKVVEELIPLRMPEKEEQYEINIITHTLNGLDLRPLEIKPAALDIDLFYNDDFKEVDEVIRARLSTLNDKGIILLHGLPGTGKTTYLRYLIGSIKKKVLFVSPAVAANLMNPEFMDLLIENPNSVLVIEDAENIIMDRRNSSHSSVSNLLNISDGLLSDCLNVQIICTFNNALHLVDAALMRKGRLIAKYEFGKLEVEKARRLSNHLGFHQLIDEPMTLADVANRTDTNYSPAKVNVIGFRRTEELHEN